MDHQAVIDAICAQRNAALNEVAALKGQLAALTKQLQSAAETQKAFDAAEDARDRATGAPPPGII